MKSKFFLRHILTTIVVVGYVSTATTFGQDTNNSRPAVSEKLNFPFGTLLKMKVEVIDGGKLNDKYHDGSLLLKIKSIDSMTLSKSVILEFKDETGKFPTDDFKLYKYLYGKETGEISSAESKKMKKKYVGYEFDIVGYETGEFSGIPNGYFKYQPVRQDFAFHFNNYLVIVADLTISKQ